MTELAKPAKSFFSKYDLDLTLINEITWRDSSNISTVLYVKLIWLDTVKMDYLSDLSVSNLLVVFYNE